MQITVKLFATLRDGRFKQKTMEFQHNSVVLDVIKALNIREEEAAIVFINNKNAELNSVLNDNDTLAIFPPVGGG